MSSLLYEVTSMTVFLTIFPDYETITDLVSHFIKTNQLVVKELIIICQIKLATQTLVTNEHQLADYPLLSYLSTFTVRQALCAINRVNFIKQLGTLRIIAFQAGHLTFNENKSVIFADIDGSNYGKLTNYHHQTKTYYWSIPENKKVDSKLVTDLINVNIEKILFLNSLLIKYVKSIG